MTEASRPIARRTPKAPPTSERAIFARVSSLRRAGTERVGDEEHYEAR